MIVQLAHLQANLGILVGIEGRNAGLGGTEGVLAQPLLLEFIKVNMIGHHDLCPVADEQLGHGHATRSQGIQLFQQSFDIQCNAGADHIVYILMEHAGGQQMQRELAIFIDNGVACVGTALKADNHIALLSKKIGHLAFAFVAPVSAYDGMNHG